MGGGPSELRAVPGAGRPGSRARWAQLQQLRWAALSRADPAAVQLLLILQAPRPGERLGETGAGCRSNGVLVSCCQQLSGRGPGCSSPSRAAGALMAPCPRQEGPVQAPRSSLALLPRLPQTGGRAHVLRDSLCTQTSVCSVPLATCPVFRQQQVCLWDPWPLCRPRGPPKPGVFPPASL